MKQLFALACCSSLLFPAIAGAESDVFGVGNGSSGALTVTTVGRVLNSYTALTSPRAPGDTTLPVASTAGFPANGLVLVIQTTGIIPAPASGSQAAPDLSADPVASWELARISGAISNPLSLTSPLVRSYAANVTQVIFVPEYTTVTVNNGRSITATPWNGSTGGVVAFLANGAVTVSGNGSIDASGAGFRGGALSGNDGTNGCTALDYTNARGGGKGEGIANTSYGATFNGRGNFANGAGGGDCHNAGGGGGGNGGPGGLGGLTWSGDGSRNVGGLGGAALAYSLLDHVTLGGGGGAGQENNSVGSAGASGGGALFIRAASLSIPGTGTLNASGLSGANTPGGGNDGAGGGGAGGSIYLRFSGSVTCANPSSITANGGNGGNTGTGQHGPGGGGGGGRILLQGNPITGCTLSVLSGVVGQSGGAGYGGGPTTSNNPGFVGATTIPPGGLPSPTTPGIGSPSNGSLTNNPRPAMSGTATPNTVVVIFLDGVEYARVSSDASGNWTYTPTANLPDGAHALQVVAEAQAIQSPKSIATAFTIDTAPPTTTITAGPSTPSTSANSSFSFTSNEPGSTFQCALDTGAFAPCASPSSFTGVADGSHTFYVQATDPAGNTETPAVSYTWVIDTTPPVTALTAKPSDPSNNPAPGFSFNANEPSTFQCTLDAGALGPCASPTSYSGLSDGSHTFTVQATDLAGNPEAVPVAYTWTIDTIPPTTTITAKPSNPSNDRNPSFSFSTGEPATFQCQLDAAAPAACASPLAFSDLADGSHTFTVRATDLAGNVELTPASYTWSLDATPPDVAISSGPAALTSDTSAALVFSSSDPTATLECHLDGGAFAPCTSPASFTGLADGPHAFQVRAKDPAGNLSSPASYDWTIETVRAGDGVEASTDPAAAVSFAGGGCHCSSGSDTTPLLPLALLLGAATARRGRRTRVTSSFL